MARPGHPQWPNPERIEDVRQIHEAMEAAGGDLDDACKLLNIPRGKLQKMLHNSPDLRTRWTAAVSTKTAAPAPEQTEKALVLQPEPSIAARLAEESSAMRTGLQKMGITGPSLDLAVTLQEFHGRHYHNCLKMIGGGLTKQFLDLMVEYEKITKELDTGGRVMQVVNLSTGKLEEKFVPLNVLREKVLRDDRAKLVEAIQRVSDRANKALLTQAMVKSRIEGRGKSSKPKGFLQINDPKSVNIVVPDGGQETDNE